MIATIESKGDKVKTDVAEVVVSERNTSAPMNVSVSLPTLSVCQNLPFSLEVMVGNLTGESVTSYDFDVLYDPNIIEPVGIDPTDKAGTSSGGANVLGGLIAPGRLAVSATSPGHHWQDPEL